VALWIVCGSGRGRGRTMAGAIAMAGIAGMSVAGCGAPAGSVGNSLPPCPSYHPRQVEILLSDSSGDRSVTQETRRLDVISMDARVAAACSAVLQAKLVAGQTRTATLWAGPVRKSGGTAVAVARLSNRYIESTVLPGVRRRLQAALRVAPPPGNSPSGLFQVAADDRSSTGGMLVVLLSDFVEQTAQVNLNRPLTSRQSELLADAIAVPDLGGAVVRIAGAGVTRETVPAPDNWVAAVRAFAARLCARTKAARCTVTTQYPSSAG
jgi:hypothetical protein